jgi:hypothetical protein
MAYAANTEVAFERSISEIIGLIRKHGAEQIGQMERREDFVLGFKIADRAMRFTIRFPTIGEMPQKDGRGSALSDAQKQSRVEQWKRQRGRALMLVIKAKLESVESGIETIEEAFLANVVMANGQTVYERISRPLELEYEGKPNVNLLAAPEI